MSVVERVRPVVGGILVWAAAGLIVGCEQDPKEHAANRGGEGAIESAERAVTPSASMATGPRSSVDAPEDNGADTSGSLSDAHGEVPAAAPSNVETQQPTTAELKQALLQRGWREVPGEDGSVLLLPPEITP